MKRAAKIYTALIFVFLFAPIVILLVFSFNEAKSLSVFSGFSLKWYQELFRDGETLNALKNTLILAVIASVVSTAMGTAAAVGMNKLRSKYLRAALDTATDIPMMNPDIITGISLMLMFFFFGLLLGTSTSLGFWSMLAAHITFCLPYVIMQVLPKLQQMDRALPEALLNMNPEDCKKLDIKDGDMVKVKSTYGEFDIKVSTSGRVETPAGLVFAPFFAEETLINLVVQDTYCPLSKEPDFKKTCVSIEKI